MEIKLNKELKSKLNLLLETKEEKMLEFSKILNIDNFSFTQEEINRLEKLYLENKDLRDYIYIYIGEAVIHIAGGFWSIGKFKKDEAYGLPIILSWGGNEMSPRISPDVWLYYIENGGLRKPLGDIIYSL
jgi:hypothetical protein